MTLQELKNAKAQNIEQQKALIAKVEAEKRDYTEAETATLTDLQAKCDDLIAQIERKEAAANVVARSLTLIEATPSTGPPTANLSQGAYEGAIVPRRVIDRAVSSEQRERVTLDPMRGYRSHGEFAVEVQAAAVAGVVSDRLRTIRGEMAAMNQTNGADGGFLVPPQMQKDLRENTAVHNDENLIPRTEVVTLADGFDSVEWPVCVEENRTSGAVAGGMLAYRVAESGTITQSAPKMGKIRLQPEEMFVMVKVTDKLLRNASALGQFLRKNAGRAFAFKCSDEIVNGTGAAGQAEGILNCDALVSVSKEAGQAAATIVAENVNKMYARMHAGCRAGAVWLANQTVLPQLQALSAVVGVGGVPVWLPPNGLAGSPNERLLGYPIIYTDYNPIVGTKGDLMFVNLKEYLSVVRGGIDEALSIHLYFDTANTAFRYRFEMGGQARWRNPFTPAKGSTLSPFIALADRA